jgi:hypothetical protein
MEAAHFCVSNILALHDNLSHRALNIQTGLIDPGLALKPARFEVKVASNMKNDFVSLGHLAEIVTSGRRSQEQSEICFDFEIQIVMTTLPKCCADFRYA